MAAHRFRVKFEEKPRALWRDIVVGGNRTLDEFQTRINDGIGLDQGHLWFFGQDRRYWSSEILFECPQEFEERPRTSAGIDGERHNAAETTVADALSDLDDERICYLYDYGDGWRFYAILKERLDSTDSDTPPQVVKTKGKQVQQHAVPGEGRYR